MFYFSVWIVTIPVLKFAGTLFWTDISSLKPCTLDDTTECEFARAVKKKNAKNIKLLRLFFTFPTTFAKSKIGTWTHVAQLPSPRALSEGPFNRKMCRCICLFFFSSLVHPFPSLDADLTSWNGCWKAFFIIIQLKVCTCGVYLCSTSFIYIFLQWIDLTSQQASHTFFAAMKMGHLNIRNTD